MKKNELLREEATKILMWAYENHERCPLYGIKKENCDIISTILKGSHKTYKYILITQLLAKSTDEEINPLAIQVCANIDGAFDARSLCHKVVVPFERKFLNNALGGSNEPYLNKPARCTHLSQNNPVRSGIDKEYLYSLIELLTGLNCSDARKYLCFAMNQLINISKEKNIIEKNIKINFSTSLELYHFMRTFLTKSCEGETCVLIIGAIEKMFYSSFSSDYKVVCHKTNESGSSSNEVGDIDIFYRNNYYYSIEVKDKNFTADDVEFALNKMFIAQAVSGAFIYGPRAKFDRQSIYDCILKYENEKFIVVFESIFDYMRHMLVILYNIDINKFKETILLIANEINVKQITLEWIKECFENYENV